MKVLQKFRSCVIRTSGCNVESREDYSCSLLQVWFFSVATGNRKRLMCSPADLLSICMPKIESKTCCCCHFVQNCMRLSGCVEALTGELWVRNVFVLFFWFSFSFNHRQSWICKVALYFYHSRGWKVWWLLIPHLHRVTFWFSCSSACTTVCARLKQLWNCKHFLLPSTYKLA